MGILPDIFTHRVDTGDGRHADAVARPAAYDDGGAGDFQTADGVPVAPDRDYWRQRTPYADPVPKDHPGVPLPHLGTDDHVNMMRGLGDVFAYSGEMEPNVYADWLGEHNDPAEHAFREWAGFRAGRHPHRTFGFAAPIATQDYLRGGIPREPLPDRDHPAYEGFRRVRFRSLEVGPDDDTWTAPGVSLWDYAHDSPIGYSGIVHAPLTPEQVAAWLPHLHPKNRKAVGEWLWNSFGYDAGGFNPNARVPTPASRSASPTRYASGGNPGWVETTADPNELTPVNDVSPEKTAALAGSIKREGWRGLPLLVVGNHQLTGSHRRAASVEAGLKEVPVVRVDPNVYFDAAKKVGAVKRGVKKSKAQFGDVEIANDDVLVRVMEAAFPAGSLPVKIAKAEVENNDDAGGNDWTDADWAKQSMGVEPPEPHEVPGDGPPAGYDAAPQTTDGRPMIARAVPGGSVVGGKSYRPGAFVPGTVVARTAPGERAAVESGDARPKPVMPRGGVFAPR